MFVYEEIENTCEKFINYKNWCVYLWHSDPGRVVLPGEFISTINLRLLYESHNIIRECYNKVGLQCLKFQFNKDLCIPDLDLININKEELSNTLNVP